MFSKDINAKETLNGTFNIEKLIKFHESPVPEEEELACDGIDC
jgi:hypothetical protein